jgi:ketosteroid isomerase-like protein
MGVDRAIDPRLIQAYELLRSLIEGAEDSFDVAEAPWGSPVPPLADPDGRLSATDLLSWWFRAPSAMGNPWDLYFNDSLRATTKSSDPPAQPLSFQAMINPDPVVGQNSTRPPHPWLASLRSHTNIEDVLPDKDAEAAVACVYEFIHAVSRRDVEQAMEMVSEDYHVFEDDREVDKLGLRHEIESLLDSLLGWEIEVSLAEVPDPLSHKYGVLVYIIIQLNAYHPKSGERRSLVNPRIARLKQQTTSQWAILALSRVS